MPEVVDSGLAEVGEDIRAWLTVTFSHQVTVDFKYLYFKFVFVFIFEFVFDQLVADSPAVPFSVP